jgi:rhodanese-related sulfurtransferase
VLKLLLGIGEPLTGRLLVYDALAARFRELKLRRDPACALCGERRSIFSLVDYDAFCGLKPHEQAVAMAEQIEIGALELKARLPGGDIVLVDVREPHELRIARIEGAVHIPLGALGERAGELDRSREIVLLCHHGVRSLRAHETLRRAGFPRLKSLRGGIDAWSRDVDPSIPRY